MNDLFLDRIIKGDTSAVARAISKVEDNAPEASELMKQIFSRTGRALIVGITGSPGAGKSSLVDKLAGFYRQRGERVGIIAVDPSSPFSGGAILGIVFGCRRCRSIRASLFDRWQPAEISAA